MTDNLGDNQEEKTNELLDESEEEPFVVSSSNSDYIPTPKRKKSISDYFNIRSSGVRSSSQVQKKKKLKAGKNTLSESSSSQSQEQQSPSTR